MVLLKENGLMGKEMDMEWKVLIIKMFLYMEFIIKGRWLRKLIYEILVI